MTPSATAQSKSSESGASKAADLDPKTLLKWLRDMVLIREFEVRTMQAYQNKQIGGFCHIYIGQEAVAVGCNAATRKDDLMITAYRDHGHALARGMEPKYCMAEMYGRIGGCAKGKGGSMHMFDKRNNLFGGHGIVGAQTPLGAGLAFATKYQDEVINGGESARVTLCFLGDGALNQGSFHEAMNLAGLFDLPVIYIVENNRYSMGTAIERGTTMANELSKKADAYGIRSSKFGGMDIFEVYDGMREVITSTRSESRPAFVEIETYRYKGHSMSDPRKYRTKDEEEQYEAEDPIDRLVAHLKNNNDLTDDDFDEMQKELRKVVKDAMKWAEESPVPDIEDELYRDVFVDSWGPYNGTSLPQMLAEEPSSDDDENGNDNDNDRDNQS